MISNDRLKDFNNVRSQPGIGDPMNRPTVQFDKYDEVNKMWICQGPISFTSSNIKDVNNQGVTPMLWGLIITPSPFLFFLSPPQQRGYPLIINILDVR